MNPVICLITNRYIVPLLASMLIFNSKGSQSRCLSCNRIKRKTDCSLASGYTFIIRFISRYRERKTETLRGKEGEGNYVQFSFVPRIYLARTEILIFFSQWNSSNHR